MKVKKGKEIEKSDIEFLEGEFVKVNQSTIRSVEGSHIELQQVGALSIDGEKVEVIQGATALLKGNEVNLNQSISGITAGDKVSVNYSLSPVTISRENAISNRSAIGIIAAKEIRSENTSAFMVIGSKVEGNITTLLDWKSALALGSVLGGLWGFFSLLMRKK